MKGYICLSQKDYAALLPERKEKIKKQFAVTLRKYFGSIDLEIIGKAECTAAEVYIMGSSKYPGYDQEIRSVILMLLGDITDAETLERTKIALNYATFNPNFNPVSDETVSAGSMPKKTSRREPRSAIDEFDYEKLSHNYQAEEPRFSFEQVILPENTRERIEEAIGIIRVEEKVFDEWGLRAIIPEATSALSFYGPPGTGKSMAAEAVAKKLGKKILRATYADIESKFHGEGPKMVKAIFKAAERDDAVLFLDESDSLLSKRLTNVSDGSAQAINSMRSQLLISLERKRHCNFCDQFSN